MAAYHFDGDSIVLELTRGERLGAFHFGELRMPISAIRAARAVDNAYAEVRGLRAPGTGVPRRLLLGTWRKRGSKSFVIVRGKAPGSVIEFDDGPFDRWITNLPVPDRLLDQS
ncbi:MAG: hypothetical protein R8F63_02125 [Acidimicrobiales bacterium]|nr:hypothetical protein [Acidimicrobiales bacterium]